MRSLVIAAALLTATLLIPASSASAESCSHVVHGHGFDTWLCVDPKGPVGCKVYSKTYHWEQGWSTSCIA